MARDVLSIRPNLCYQLFPVGLLAVLAFPGGALAQARTVVSDRPACGRCRIEVGNIEVVLGTAAHPLDGGVPAQVTQDASGRFYVLQGYNGLPPQVFDRRGNLLTTIGRSGSGPGEFRSAAVVALGPADSVAIWDLYPRRITVLSPTGEVARSFAFPGEVSSMLWLPGRHDLLINGLVRSPDRFGFAFHRLDSSGTIQRSFGEQPSSRSLHEPPPIARVLVPAGPNSFFAATVNAPLQFESWSGDRLVRTWLRPSPVLDRAAPGDKLGLRARVNGLTIDASQRAVVLITVPDPHWERGVRAKRLPDGEQTYQFLDLDRVFDSLIEVIDLQSGTVMVRHRFDEAYLWLLPTGRLVRYRDDQPAGSTLEVRKLNVLLR